MEKNNKKSLKLDKETLVRLQEDQMKALIGADNMTTQSGAVCGNDGTLNPTPAPKDNDLGLGKLGLALDESCCRRSCRDAK